MATENPILPAPVEQVSPEAEDVLNPAAEPCAEAGEKSVTASVASTAEQPAGELGAAAETASVQEDARPLAPMQTEPAEPAGVPSAGETPAELTGTAIAGSVAVAGVDRMEPAAEEKESGRSGAAAESAARAKRVRIGATTESVAEGAAAGAQSDAGEQVDFAEEEAELAARGAGLELGEETPEEAEQQELPALPQDSFEGKSKEELIDLFARMIGEQPVQSLRREIEALKIAFYKLHRADNEAARKAFVDAGGAEAEFVPPVDETELRFKDLFKEYRRRRDEFIANIDAEKERNLQVKLGIIGELKELIDSDETINHTFTKFRELQQRWKDTGVVPLQHVKDLWETYNLHVENFYNFIKINKELRDLDLKKNFEQKTALCEQAETLVLEPSVVEAFHKLQKLHDEWRETGPVANEYKEALWERFKEASSRINKQHQAYFERIKAEQMRNLELKAELCAATEELAVQPVSTRKEWNRASDRLLEIQKTWKTIGFAPKKENNRIYERFRTACDRFFEAKRAFYSSLKTEMDHNLQLKNEICEAAEALQHSEEWKKTTDELIALQARWKEIGAVPRRYSDQVWKRFRSACDRFFERKAAHFADVDGEHEENLRRKQALLDEMSAADVHEGGFEMIKSFQRRWSEIGFVPIRQKDAVQKRYKAVVDALFDTLRGTERDRSMNRFREKVSAMKGAGEKRFRSERERLYNRVRQMEQEIALLENNIGFFARSKNAEALIADVRAKIDRAKEEMAAAIEKVKVIDREQQNDAKE